MNNHLVILDTYKYIGKCFSIKCRSIILYDKSLFNDFVHFTTTGRSLVESVLCKQINSPTLWRISFVPNHACNCFDQYHEMYMAQKQSCIPCKFKIFTNLQQIGISDT